tara:strand:+ start:657 stop:773 length:117 start_codon:yes stop_codon:yes gene_type:complete
VKIASVIGWIYEHTGGIILRFVVGVVETIAEFGAKGRI